MLDNIYDIYQNDCIIDDRNSFLLNKLLDLDEKCRRNYIKITDEIELVNTDIPYHQQNIEFINNLQSKFGGKITIDLYNLDSDKISRYKIYSSSSYCDFNDLLSCKNKIDRITYLETKHNNNDNNVIIMVLKIENTTEQESTYYLIHDKYTSEKDLKSLGKYFQNNSNDIYSKLKTKTEKELRKKYQDPKKINENNKEIYEHLVSKIPDIIEHIRYDHDKFVENDYNFCQKLLLHMFNEPTDLLKVDNINKNQPTNNESHTKNTNTTNNQEKDKKKSDEQQNTPIFDFIVKKYDEFNEINEFANVLLHPNIQIIQKKWSTYYSDLLVCMRKILINEILVNNFIKINTSRSLYLQIKQITAPKDDYDTLTKCINETFCKKKKQRHAVYMKCNRVKSRFL
ncbi:hypothetical protein BDAP_001345 [Binucleata daphniae]